MSCPYEKLKNYPTYTVTVLFNYTCPRTINVRNASYGTRRTKYKLHHSLGNYTNRITRAVNTRNGTTKSNM